MNPNTNDIPRIHRPKVTIPFIMERVRKYVFLG